jgi:hypothetical protein
MPQYNGVWTIEAAAQAQSNQQWVTDPNFKNTTLLLQADGVGNGSQNNTFLDSSSNAFPITRVGNTTQGTFTPFSQPTGRWSNYFGGSTDYISFTSIAAYGLGTSNYTIECNASFNSTAGNQRIFCIGVSGTDGLVLQYTGGTGLQLFSAASGSATVFTYAFTPAVGIWYNFAVVRSGTGTNQVVLYVNGTSVATGTSSVSVGQNQALVGGLSWNSTYTVNGYINNFRLSNTARYSANFNPSTIPFSSDANTILLTCQNSRFLDNSSTGNTFTIGGTPSVQPFSPFAPQFQWTPAVIGGSGYFDGTGDYLSTASNAAFAFSSGTYTIEMWLYPNNVAALQGLFTMGNFRFFQNTTGLWFLNSSSSIINVATGLSVGQWFHVALVREGTGTNQTKLYLNGVLIGTGTDNATWTASTVYIASEGAGSYLNGYLSNVRVLKGTALYTAAFTPPTAPLTAITNTSLLLNFINAGIYDGAMKNNLETAGNAQVNTSIVKYGSGSMYFDGTGDALAIPADAKTNLQFGTGNFTIEFWALKTADGSTTYDSVISIGSTGNYIGGFNVELSATRGFCFVYDSAVQVQSNFNPNDGKWHHYAVVRNNNVFALYRDGIQLTTATLTPTLGITGNAFVGAGVNSTSSNFNGYLDDLRVTRGIARYTANFIPPQVALPRQ